MTEGSTRRALSKHDILMNGIFKLTHHRLKQPQDIGSKTTPEYSIWWLDPSAIS